MNVHQLIDEDGGKFFDTQITFEEVEHITGSISTDACGLTSFSNVCVRMSTYTFLNL